MYWKRDLKCDLWKKKNNLENERQKQGFDVSRGLPLMVKDEALENDGEVVWLPGR